MTGGGVVHDFSFHATPHHTIDHAQIVVGSGGVRALFAGDVLHHPLQIGFDPEWNQSLQSRPWRSAMRRTLTQSVSVHIFRVVCCCVTYKAGGYNWRFEQLKLDRLGRFSASSTMW